MQKERVYTVQEVEEGVPRITIRGKWLDGIGLGLGTKLRYVEGKNMIILVKVPEKDIAAHDKNRQISRLERQLNFMRNENALVEGF